MDWALFAQQVFYGLSNGMAYALFAIGLVVIFGILGIINVAHGEFYMMGAMVFSWLVASQGVNIVVAAVIALAVGVVIGILSHRLVVQPIHGKPGFVLATFLATLGLSIFLANLATVIWGAFPINVTTPFSWVARPGGIAIAGDRIVLFVIGGAVLWLLMLWMSRSLLGKQLQAAAQDAVSARLVGINLMRVYAIGFGLASVLAVVSGILMSPIWTSNPYMGPLVILKGFIVTIVAGMGNFRGAIIVGLLLGLVEAIFGQYVAVQYREAVGYGVMILVLLFKPEGLFRR